jgi:hypothetical protein
MIFPADPEEIVKVLLQPWRLLLWLLARWTNRQQQGMIEYLWNYNQGLCRKLARMRVRRTDQQRCRMAGILAQTNREE